ncbi:hypothetical protein GCK32_011170 [Trichostrongylus colubriformis]|uniref:Uncharacterized protein n=1 Tax=Trichostrongylus colubriformis TaxID=6319 RepID=A0AAN8ILV8_TRICO
MLICRRTMTDDELQQEQKYINDASTISQSYSFGADDTCEDFRKVLSSLVRFRFNFCGDLSRCTCSETRWEAPIVRCGYDCERIWREGLMTESASQKIIAHFIVYFLIRMFMWW